MEINVQLTEDIINRSLHLHYKSQPPRERWKILYVPVLLVGISVYLLIKDYTSHQFTQTSWLAIVYIFMAIALGWYSGYKREHTGKQLLKSFGENSAFDMDVTDDEVITRLSDSTLNFQWTVFTKALISKDIVILYQQNNSLSMFDKSFFANDDFSRFKTMVRKHMMDVKEV